MMSLVKASSKEEEYHLRQEAEKLKARAEQLRRETEQAEREELKQLHWMRCPKCGMELAEIAYRGVRVDACFACGGMYLDYGEVEKILEFKEPGTMRKMMSALFGSGSD